MNLPGAVKTIWCSWSFEVETVKKVEFEVEEREEYTIIHFELRDVLSPEALRDMEPPQVKGTKGVVLSGRGPVWLYCFLAHHYHPTLFVATYDPRLGGAVIVESYSPNYKVGEILKVELEG
ncbi:MAG: CRISPR-associated protein Csx3 [Candidatus Freyarchaeota archaeon]|nr:CRISPR-associated protein Csx3 [Candidatus Jordarchaeia archaeon]